jgi:N-methylhydantoinase B
MECKDIDPVTYEVIRYRLWRAVWDAGVTCCRMCVSPVIMITRDLQPALFTEDGDCVFLGPYLVYMAGMLEVDVKWTLENRGDNPGINKDDIFFQNDPWVGTAHQPDVGIYGPIVVDNEIFGWSAICEHQNDIGGVAAGSFCMNALDIWYDPQPVPPIKLVEGGTMRQDLLDLCRRMSRTPVNLELDLRAGIAGNTLLKNRVLELVNQYGHKLVKGVMHAVINNSERAYLKRIDSIPDGTWGQTTYIQAATSNDRKAHRLVLTVEKRGTELYVTNEGTDPQVGAINLTYAAWVGGVLGMLGIMFVPEQMGAFKGAWKHVHFNPVSGTIVCPEFGVAVSPAGTIQSECNISMANSVLARMLLCSRDENVRNLALTAVPGEWPFAFAGGFWKDTGEFYIAMYAADYMLGSSGATLHSDGQYGGGVSWIPEGRAANNEENERNFPLLTVWRRTEPYSAVPGKRTSGEAGSAAYTAYGGTHAPVFVVDEETAPSAGIFGLPGSRCKQSLMENTNLKELYDSGIMPTRLDEVKGQIRKVQPREAIFGVSLMDIGELNGIYEWSLMSSSAFGDPIAREPSWVQKDVVKNKYTKEQAEKWFGVVLKEDQSADLVETEKKRSQIRKERLAKSVIPKGGK